MEEHLMLEFHLQRIEEMKVSNERVVFLNKIVNYVYKTASEKKTPKLNFICTHNSRRSQFCQFWATFFSIYYKIKCEVYSGGTLETEVYKSVVNNIRDYGFNISFKDCDNPIYSINFGNQKLGNYFSKLYNGSENPKNEFAAIMTCSDAEKNCPLVEGSEIKFSLPYEDPKKYDMSKIEKTEYEKTSEKIASEMNYLFHKTKLKMMNLSSYLILFLIFPFTLISCTKDDKCGVIIDKVIIENRYYFIFDSDEFNQFGGTGINQTIYYVPDNRSSGEVSKDVYNKFRTGEEYCQS